MNRWSRLLSLFATTVFLGGLAPVWASSAVHGPINAFILDPGHGGDDFGAVAAGRHEKDIVLAIARKVRARLEQIGGIPARLTRETDVFVPLDARVDEGLAGTAFISLHLNKVRFKKLRGIRIYAFGKDGHQIPPARHHRQKVAPLPPPPKEEARASAVLAGSIARSLRSRGFKTDPPARAGFYVLKNPRAPSVLIEMGYLSNPQEAAELADASYQDKLADAIAASLQAYAVQAGSVERPAAASVTASNKLSSR